MKIIEKLSEMIDDELCGAEHYVKCAIKHKEDNRSLAETFYAISNDEMRHVSMLHGEVVKLIEQHKREKGEPPAEMLAVYNYLHEKQIDKAADIKAMQNMYKES